MKRNSAHRVIRLAVYFTGVIFALLHVQTAIAQSVENRPIEIELSNGTVIPLTLRVLPAAVPSIKAADTLAQMYEELVSAANSGDVSAARYLGKALRVCKSSFTSEAELEAAVERLYSTGLRHYGDGREPVQKQGVAQSDVESGMRLHFYFCKDVSKTETQKASNWTKMAADNGDYNAIKNWIELIGANDESYRLWHRAFSQGHVKAAQELVYHYQNGISREMAGRPDYVSAYVYQTIAFKVMAAAKGNIVIPGSPSISLADSYDAVLSEMAYRLDESSLQAANERIAAILLNNKNCCRYPN